MITFIKVQAASIIGSLADYLTTIILVELFGCWYVFANLIGNIAGGILQFMLSRYWVFKSGKHNTLLQAGKFVIFFLGNIVLSGSESMCLQDFSKSTTSFQKHSRPYCWV